MGENEDVNDVDEILTRLEYIEAKIDALGEALDEYMSEIEENCTCDDKDGEDEDDETEDEDEHDGDEADGEWIDMDRNGRIIKVKDEKKEEKKTEKEQKVEKLE